MKPVSVKVTSKAVFVMFDDGREIEITKIPEGARDYAIEYLTGVMGLKDVQKSRGVSAGYISIDQSIEDWSIGMNAYRYATAKNDALLHVDVETDFPQEYLERIQVERVIAEQMAGIFGDLANGN